MSEDYEVGYKKPPVETRFGAGNNANPNGKTSEHRKAEIKAAELAAKVQLDLVEALSKTLEMAKDDADKVAAIKSDVLKLLKDAQDRGFGQPKSAVDLSSEDGSMSPPSVIQLVPVTPDTPESDVEAR